MRCLRCISIRVRGQILTKWSPLAAFFDEECVAAPETSIYTPLLHAQIMPGIKLLNEMKRKILFLMKITKI